MFRLEESEFGPYRRYRFDHPELGHGFDVVPEVASTITQIRFAKTNVIDGYETPDELHAGKWGKCAILFPFPNRLRDGKYSWHEKNLAFPINNAATQNAIHGFVRHERFQLETIQLTEEHASITSRFVADGKNPAYPFPFTLDVTFTITKQSQFFAQFSVTNHSDQSIPLGLGWHPYFRLAPTANEHRMQLPSCERVEIDERMIPTGKRSAYSLFQDQRSLDDTLLDTCFAIAPDNEDWQAKLSVPGKTLTLRAPRKDFPFFQVFTPPARTSIAIEPMTCNVDAFHNREGLLELGPNANWTTKFGIEYVTDSV